MPELIDDADIKRIVREAVQDCTTIRAVAAELGLQESNLSRSLSTSATSRPLSPELLADILKVIVPGYSPPDPRLWLLQQAGIHPTQRKPRRPRKKAPKK